MYLTLGTLAKEWSFCRLNICSDRTLEMKAIRSGAPRKHDLLHLWGKDILIRSPIDTKQNPFKLQTRSWTLFHNSPVGQHGHGTTLTSQRHCAKLVSRLCCSRGQDCSVLFSPTSEISTHNHLPIFAKQTCRPDMQWVCEIFESLH